MGMAAQILGGSGRSVWICSYNTVISRYPAVMIFPAGSVTIQRKCFEDKSSVHVFLVLDHSVF